jgi:hypothetical protein
VFRITPMTFCIMGDFRQSDSLVFYCWSYYQSFVSRLSSGSLPNCAVRVFNAHHDRSDFLVAGKLQPSGLTLGSSVEENVVPVY